MVIAAGVLRCFEAFDSKYQEFVWAELGRIVNMPWRFLTRLLAFVSVI